MKTTHFVPSAQFREELDRFKDHSRFLQSINNNVIRFGVLTQSQIYYTQRVLDRYVMWTQSNNKPFPRGRFLIQGLVIELNREIGKLTVLTNAGFAFRGPIPEDFSNEIEYAEYLQMSASVWVSREDPTFGYYRNPTDIQLI